MRIYAVADIHGKHRVLELIEKNIKKFKPDIVVAAGDITSYRRSGSFISQLNRLSAPVLGIRGNTDRLIVDKWLDYFSNTHSLHLKSHSIDGLTFTGVSGTAPVPFGTRLRLYEKPLITKMKNLIEDADVLVAHPPPYGVLDKAFGKFHVGSRSIGKIVSRHSPRLMLCGHIHEHVGRATLGETIIVNCSVGSHGEGVVIDISRSGPIHVQVLTYENN